MSAIDNSGEMVIIYRGKLQFNLYKIHDRNEASKIKTFNVREEIRANIG